MRRAVVLLGFLVLGACKSPPSTVPAVPPEPTPAEADTSKQAGGQVADPATPGSSEPTATVCKRDGECTLSTFGGCCSCCPGPVRAFFKPDLAKLEAKCQTVRCSSCDQVCPPEANLKSYSALCENARCVAEPH